MGDQAKLSYQVNKIFGTPEAMCKLLELLLPNEEIMDYDMHLKCALVSIQYLCNSQYPILQNAFAKATHEKVDGINRLKQLLHQKQIAPLCMETIASLVAPTTTPPIEVQKKINNNVPLLTAILNCITSDLY